MLFGCEWGKKSRTVRKDLSFRHVKTVSPSVWCEHCVECAAPLCYGTCPKYRPRCDGHCKLFDNGISKVGKKGLLKSSVEIEFGEWSKLETVFRSHQISKFHNRILGFCSKAVFALSKVLSWCFEKRRTLKRWPARAYELRERLADHANSKSHSLPDAFYIYVQNDADEVDLILETKGGNCPGFKQTFHLRNGDNEFVVPYDDIAPHSSEPAYIFVTLSRPHALIFHALDFVTFSRSFVEGRRITGIASFPKGKFIKCVAWDLDNTVWNGVLIEGAVQPKNEIADVMRQLDSRGIVNSVISKNSHDEAWEKLQELGLADLIVFPQINWLPKSHNLSVLAKQMNIGIDAICFIDDSPFELEEVRGRFPDVLCLDAEVATSILDEPCFQPPLSADSNKRRLTYKMMEKENAEKERWAGDINGFLKTCNICVEVSKPQDGDLPRCFELIQRTNQLNASGRRLSMEEITAMVHSDDFATHVLRCHDKFGDYGIVGFSIYSKKEDAITDFVISCRVANKTIEQTYVQWLYEKRNNDSPLGFHYLKTNKNGPLYMVMESLGMKAKQGIEEESLIYQYRGDCERYDIVELIDNSEDL